MTDDQFTDCDPVTPDTVAAALGETDHGDIIERRPGCVRVYTSDGSTGVEATMPLVKALHPAAAIHGWHLLDTHDYVSVHHPCVWGMRSNWDEVRPL